jgi:hypothetical protein
LIEQLHRIGGAANTHRYSITSSALAMAIGECREEHHVEGRAR